MYFILRSKNLNYNYVGQHVGKRLKYITILLQDTIIA